MNELYGVMNASPEKRYKNFISRVADNEEVWVLDNGEGYATLVQIDYISLIVYPSKEAAEFFSEGDEVMSIEVHDFVNNCEETIGLNTINKLIIKLFFLFIIFVKLTNTNTKTIYKLIIFIALPDSILPVRL